MERAPQGEVRTPTSRWADLGLSKTSPFALETTPTNANSSSANLWTRPDTASPYNLGATTGMIDGIPANQRALLIQHKDIHSLMTHLGLDHYISKFFFFSMSLVKVCNNI